MSPKREEFEREAIMRERRPRPSLSSDAGGENVGEDEAPPSPSGHLHHLTDAGEGSSLVLLQGG